MNIFTVTGASPMGTKDEKYGWTMWGYVQEQEMPIMFNTMRDLTDGDFPLHLTAEETAVKTSSKGKTYMRLSKVKIAESSGSADEILHESSSPIKGPAGVTPAAAAAHPSIEAKIDEILSIVKDLRGDNIDSVESIEKELNLNDEI